MLPGIKPNRTWVYAPRAATLEKRWRVLIAEEDLDQKRLLLRESGARKIDTVVGPLAGYVGFATPLSTETGECPKPTAVTYRSFDRQYIIPDNRLLHRGSPNLWRAALMPDQIYLIEQHSKWVSSGPGVALAALMPDMDAFKGSEGGRVLPVFQPDGRPTTTISIRKEIGVAIGDGEPVQGDDLAAYVAAVVAHPAYTARFTEQLKSPGIRVPITADPDLWCEAVEHGRTVLWLHTYGERCVDPATARPRGAVEATGDARVRNMDGIPATEDGMPSTITHSSDPASRRTDEDGDTTLYIDDARFRPVSAAVWQYQVGGRRVVKSWFDYRRGNPSGRRSSPLDEVNATTWARTDTEELIRLLGVLHRLTELEAQQSDLLDRICAGNLLSVQALTAAGALPVRTADRVLSDMGAGLGLEAAADATSEQSA